MAFLPLDIRDRIRVALTEQGKADAGALQDLRALESFLREVDEEADERRLYGHMPINSYDDCDVCNDAGRDLVVCERCYEKVANENARLRAKESVDA